MTGRANASNSSGGIFPWRDDQHARHLLEKIPENIRLVWESDIEAFTEEVATEIAKHDDAEA